MGHIWPIRGNGMDGLTHTLEMVMDFCSFCCYENCMERKPLFCQDMDKILNKKNVTLLGSNSDKRHAGLTQRLRTAETVTNDTKMCLKCKSDGEKCKYNSILTAAWPPPQYGK